MPVHHILVDPAVGKRIVQHIGADRLGKLLSELDRARLARGQTVQTAHGRMTDLVAFYDAHSAPPAPSGEAA